MVEKLVEKNIKQKQTKINGHKKNTKEKLALSEKRWTQKHADRTCRKWHDKRMKKVRDEFFQI